jgi:uncharacterized protein YvpB
MKKLSSIIAIGIICAGAYFVTQDRGEVKLSVPYFSQQYQNSCEEASLRMALAYHSIETDDMQIAERAGYDPRPKDYEKNIWDDPQKMFVGYIDSPANGYGVYGKPITKAARSFGRGATYITHVTPAVLALSIAMRNPVVLWGNNGINVPPYAWKTPAGNEVKAFGGEHVRLVVGYRGSILSPDGFYLHDPINGGQYVYWDTDKLMENVRSVPGVTNQAVIVS